MILNKNNYANIISGNRISRTKSLLYIPDPETWHKTNIEAVYCYKNNIDIEPKCYCNNPLNFKNMSSGYSACCSTTCSRSIVRPKDKDAKMLNKNNVKDIYTNNGRLKSSANIEYIIPEELYWCNSIREAGYCITNNIVKKPMCPNCKIKATTYTYSHASEYTKFCGRKCANSSEETKINKELSCLNKYGVKNGSQICTGLSNSLYYDPSKYYRYGYLYIMESKELNKIKIGVSMKPDERIKSFLKFIPDIKIVKKYFFAHVYMYEDYYHRKYNLDNNPLLEGDGRTEWFNISVKNDILLELDKIYHL